MSDETTTEVAQEDDSLASEVSDKPSPTTEGDISDATPGNTESRNTEPDAERADTAADAPPIEPEPEPADEPEPRSRREAKYRTQLREAEAERDQLAATVEALQRTEVERVAADWIAEPTALWAAAGVQLADLVTENGTVDAAKVTAAARAAREQLGLAMGPEERKLHGPIVPKEGMSHADSSRSNRWEDAFKM